MVERGSEGLQQPSREIEDALKQLAIVQARVLKEAGVVYPELEGDLPQAVKAKVAPKIDLHQQAYDVLS